jgi:hypothetical protein
MSDYGIDSESAAIRNLIAGGVKTKSVAVKASEGALTAGQVLEFSADDDAFKKYVSGSAANAYAVVAEPVTIGAAGGYAVCIVQGSVNKSALDATAQADAEIEAALLGSGIICVNQQV